MARTRGRGDTILKVPELLTALGEMRGRRIKASMDVRPYGPAYHVVSMVVRAIDALATFVTGQRDYFSVGFKPRAWRGSKPLISRLGLVFHSKYKPSVDIYSGNLPRICPCIIIKLNDAPLSRV